MPQQKVYKNYVISKKIACYTKNTHQIYSSEISKYLEKSFRKSHKILGFYHQSFTSNNVFEKRSFSEDPR